ncbi:MAG: AAA family ATPase, partial [Candidatus Altiarchaeota archaeon]|nr:AAA family ATPase [Candidatus Altiarchaeota archaeon]
MANKLRLSVKEAPKTDVGRAIVRLSSRSMNSLGIRSGEVVEIKGAKTAAGIAWRGMTEDESRDIIRMDGVLRSNAGVGLDDDAEVSKAEAKLAKKVVLSPTQQIQYGAGFVEYVHERLVHKPLIKGNKILVDVMGTPLTFVV